MSPDPTVVRGADLADLPVADFLSGAEPLVPIDRVDQLFAPQTRTGGAGGARATEQPVLLQEPAELAPLEPWPGETTAADVGSSEEPPPEPEPLDAEEAFRQGWIAGNQAATNATERTRALDASMVDSVVRAIAGVQSALSGLDGTRDQIAVDLGLAIARLVLDRELEAIDDAGRDALVRVLPEVSPSAVATFRLHPNDLSRLAAVEELLNGRGCELIADPAVASGDVLVDVDGGTIDGTVAGALERVAAVLRS